jgi:hypothetical protein
MNSYLLLFRANYRAIDATPADEMQNRMNTWNEWIGGIAAAEALAGGNHLAPTGKVAHGNGKATDGPYTTDDTAVLGYIIVKAADYEAAMAIAERCPILGGTGNTIEVRQLAAM